MVRLAKPGKFRRILDEEVHAVIANSLGRQQQAFEGSSIRGVFRSTVSRWPSSEAH